MDTIKKHLFVLVPLFIISFILIYLPEPYLYLSPIFFFFSFLVCTITSWVSSARNNGLKVFNFNTMKQFKIASATKFNKIEKTVLIYCIVIMGSFLASLFLYPFIK